MADAVDEAVDLPAQAVGLLRQLGGGAEHAAGHMAGFARRSWVPWEAWLTDWAISRVAEPCSSTAEAMVVVISLIRRMVPVMPLMALTALPVTACIWLTWAWMSSVALAVWLARFLTSEATTAKPLPASPARAASMVALRASRLVCEAISLMRLTTSPIFWAASERLATVSLVRLASSTATAAMREDSPIWRPISPTELASSSVAAATVWTFSEASSAAWATAAA